MALDDCTKPAPFRISNFPGLVAGGFKTKNSVLNAIKQTIGNQRCHTQGAT